MITPAYVREILPKLVDVQVKIDLVISELEVMTGWLFNSRTNYVEYIYWYPNVAEHQLSLRPISTVSKVEEQIDGTWVEIGVDDYYMFNQQLIKKIGYWDYSLKVTCTGGYTVSTTPEFIKFALRTQIAFLETRLKEDVLAVSQKSLGQGASSVFLDPNMHPRFRECISRYKRY